MARVIQPQVDCYSAKDFLDALSPLGAYLILEVGGGPASGRIPSSSVSIPAMRCHLSASERRATPAVVSRIPAIFSQLRGSPKNTRESSTTSRT
jgi:hypothetical protein